MLKFFSFGKINTGVLVTLLVLIALGCSYLFIYLPNNEKIVQERRFRCLRNIDVNIRTQIDNSITQITALLKNYEEYSGVDPKTNLKNDSLFTELKKYVKRPQINFIYLLPDQANKYLSDTINKRSNNTSDKGPICFREDKVSGIKFYINVGSQFTLLASKLVKTDHKTETITIGIQFKIEQFIQPLLPSDVFENYIVFIGDTKFYETAPLGLNYKDADSLLTVKSKIITPGLRSLNISGIDYKLFSHPLYTYTNNRWIITGLVSNKDYLHERNQLPPWILLLLLTTALTMLVSLPWIKLYHMGNKDRLTIKDGIASVLVSMILMSLLFFMFFKYRLSFSEERLSYSSNDTSVHTSYPLNGYSRNILASKISNAVIREINTAYNLLDSFDKKHKKSDTDVNLLGRGKKREIIKYDTLFNKYGRLVETVNKDTTFEIKNNGQKNPIRKGKSILVKSDSIPKLLYTKYDILYQKTSHHIHAQEIYWLYTKGVDSTNLTVDSNNAPKGNYDDRIYYKNAMANRYNTTGRRDNFYIDQIVSRPEGNFRTVIAKKNRDGQVAAMTFTVQSLDSVIMPDGFQFAIIDNNGRVLYHSRASRNLNENLKDEFADSSQLVSSIEAKSDTSFKAEYYGRRYNVKIKPIPGLPYFTVIFEDLVYNDTRDIEAYTFTLSMLICLLLFLIIKFCVVFFVSSRQSIFKKQHFDTSWIGPKPTSHHQYNLAVVTNLFIIVMMLIFFNLSSFLEYLYILVASIIFTSLFLNCIFACKYQITDPYKFKLKRAVIVCLCLFLALIDIAAGFNLKSSNLLSLLLYELILAIVLSGIYYKKIISVKFYNRPWTYTQSYALMATTRLIICSGIPVAFFFIYSYNYEQNLDTRYRQLNFAHALAHKVHLTKANKTDTIVSTVNIQSDSLKLDSIKNNRVDTAGIYTDGLYIDLIAAVDITKNGRLKNIKNHIASYEEEDSLTAKILSAFRFRINNIEIKNNNLNSSHIDNSVFFNNLQKEKFNKTSKAYYKITSNEYIKIDSSPYANYRMPVWYVWGLLLVLLFLFYYFIHNVIRKIFTLDIHHTNRWIKMDYEVLKNNILNKQVLIVGSPGSDSFLKLKYWINNEYIKGSGDKPFVFDEENTANNTVYVADMMRIPTSWEGQDDWKKCRAQALSGYPLVIINHFEYNISNAKSNSSKLDLLEELLGLRKSKIIIISTVHPVSFIDSFSQGAQCNPISDGDLERWHMLLGNFRVMIDPLISSYVPENAKMPEKAIIEESTYSRFLHDMQKISLGVLNKEISSVTKYSRFLKFIDEEIALISSNKEIKCNRFSEFLNNEKDLIPQDEIKTDYSYFVYRMQKITSKFQNYEISSDNEKKEYKRFLYRAQKIVIKFRDKDTTLLPSGERAKDRLTDSMIFKLQLTSQYFYTDIWQSLTHEEKFILYDLAEDGLVNSYDDFNLSMLICKGLIINDDGVLMPFNKSFRNFILTAIGKKEVDSIKDQIKDNSRWGNLKAPLSLAILAILVFLFASQQGEYSQIITYITAFGAAIPTISKVFSAFGGSETKKVLE
jgi:hypothetical protein